MEDKISSSSMLITGGTGSFGKAFLKYLIKNHPEVKRIVIFSRDELKQWNMQQEYPKNLYPQLRFFLGDIRDLNRLKRAFEGVDTVIHAAALKQVPAAEENPFEFIKTNIIGAENVINAGLDMGIKKIIALSTDKAAAPVNLYGATKLCSDKLFIAANNFKGSRDMSFSVVRYGNVMGSRGSVIPFFLEKAKEGFLPITDPAMTRFNISLEESVKMVIWALNNSIGGELFVPKLKSYRLLDLAEAIGPSCKKPIIGIRSGEKIHEEMITIADSYNTIQLDNYYAILPSNGELLSKYKNKSIFFTKFKQNTSYNSGNNDEFLTVKELRNLISKYILKDFKPI